MGNVTHIRVNINGKWFPGIKAKIPPPRERCTERGGKKRCWKERSLTVYIPKHIESEYVVILPYEAIQNEVPN